MDVPTNNGTQAAVEVNALRFLEILRAYGTFLHRLTRALTFDAKLVRASLLFHPVHNIHLVP